MSVESLITQHIDIWTSAVQTKSTSGRGTSSKLDLYGIKKLRELILELAVRGKLVSQDPNDEPASVLLERIAKEKAKLVKDKIIKKQKALSEVDTDEFLFEIPEKWSWTRLGSITEIGPRNTDIPDDLDVSFVPMPLITTNTDGQHGSEIKKWGEIKKGYTHFANGDIALAKITPCFENSKAAVFSGLENGVGAGTTELHVARPIADTLDARYILLFLKAPIFLKIGETKMTGSAGQKRVPKDFFAQYPLPFPPLKEQHRIVAKVDELMKLCDQLEQQTEASITAHQVLVETLLATLINSADAEELMENWERISAHFDTLFTTIDAIDQLKQTILQLAVMGKLVPQNPADESPTLLLDRIQKHQLSRIKNKEIQKPKRIVPSDELDLDIPRNWQSILLNNLVFVTKLAGFEYTKYIKLKDAGQVAVIRAQNVRPFSPSLENIKYIDSETSLSLPRSALDRPALLVTFIGAGIGDVCVFDKNERWHLAPNVAKVEPFADLNLSYLCLYLNSSIGRKELFKSMKSTAQPSLSMTSIRQVWVALPPIEEQSRIVCKVRELMDLCQQLQTSIKDGQATQLHLTDAIVEQVL